MGGPTAAFPEHEARGWQQWEAVMKPFIDQAGPEIDFLSVHLYDTMGANMDGDPTNCTWRSGGNVDALLDLYVEPRAKWD